MHVRIAQFHVPSENWERAVSQIRDQVVPGIREVPGFVAGAFAGDREAQVAWGIVFWESREAMLASEDAAARIRAEAVEGAGLGFTGVERFEVIASEGLPTGRPPRPPAT